MYCVVGKSKYVGTPPRHSRYNCTWTSDYGHHHTLEEFGREFRGEQKQHSPSPTNYQPTNQPASSLDKHERLIKF